MQGGPGGLKGKEGKRRKKLTIGVSHLLHPFLRLLGNELYPINPLFLETSNACLSSHPPFLIDFRHPGCYDGERAFNQATRAENRNRLE